MTQEPFFVEQHWDIGYRHAAGDTAGRFLSELQQSQRLWGRRCPQCKRVLMPPRSFCDRCHAATTEWVEAGKEGVIEAFTIVNTAFKGLPEPPYALAYVRLNGADTAMCNYVQNVDLANPREAARKLWVGTRVKVAFSSNPQGRMTDFWYELA